MEGYFVHIASHVEKIRRADGGAPEANTIQGKILQEIKSWELWRAVLAEFIATLLFVFIGTMSAVGMVTVVDEWAKIIRVSSTSQKVFYDCL